MDAKDIWPLPNYNPGERLHLHALGVISITYAAFERNIDSLYEFHQKASAVEEFLGRSIKRRINIIRQLYLKNDSAEISEAVDNLLDYFDRCCCNRNELLHAEFYPAAFGGDPESLYLIKRADKRSRDSVYMKFKLAELRTIADQMRAGVIQAAELHIYRRFQGIPIQKVPKSHRPYVVRPPSPLEIPVALHRPRQPQA